MLHESLKSLFDTAEPASLGPEPRAGTMSEDQLRDRLARAADALGLAEPRRPAILALLFLWHDHSEASHVISQGMDNADGSFVHALMHRREPDYGNARYWWRRVGDHVALARIGARAAAYLRKAKREDLIGAVTHDGAWDPMAFTAACERVTGRAAGDAEVELLRELQRIEFEVLLEHLAASGGRGEDSAGVSWR